MVVQTRIHNGHEVAVRTFRDIYKTKGLAELREGFYAQRDNKWGLMLQLKGNTRIKLGEFGNVPADEIDKQRSTGIAGTLRRPEDYPNVD